MGFRPDIITRGDRWKFAFVGLSNQTAVWIVIKKKKKKKDNFENQFRRATPLAPYLQKGVAV